MEIYEIVFVLCTFMKTSPTYGLSQYAGNSRISTITWSARFTSLGSIRIDWSGAGKHHLRVCVPVKPLRPCVIVTGNEDHTTIWEVPEDETTVAVTMDITGDKGQAMLNQRQKVITRAPLCKTPRFIAQPESGIMGKQNYTLTCQADGPEGTRIAWYKDNAPLFSGGDIHIQQEGKLLSIRQPSGMDRSDKWDGTYTCKVTAPHCGKIVSREAVLKRAFLSDRRQTSEENPIHVDAEVGYGVILNCDNYDAFPIEAVKASWKMKSSGNYQTVKNSQKFKLLSNGRRLLITSVTEDDMSAIFRCRVANTLAQSGRYDYLRLTHGESKQLLTTIPASGNLTVIRGRPEKLGCFFSNPDLTVRWEHNGASLAEQNNFLTVNASESGTYSCYVKNHKNHIVNAMFHVTVESAPRWEAVPQNVTVAEGSHVALTCAVHGVPAPKLSWLVNGESVGSPQPRNGQGDKRPVWIIKKTYVSSVNTVTSLLTLPSATRANVYIVQCVARQEHGTLIASAVVRETAVRTWITKLSPDREVVLGSGRQLNLTCDAEAQSNQRLTIRWIRQRLHDETVTHGSRSVERPEVLPLTLNGTILFRAPFNTTSSVSWKYTCIASSSSSNDSRSVVIRVEPSDPITPRARLEGKQQAGMSDFSGIQPYIIAGCVVGGLIATILLVVMVQKKKRKPRRNSMSDKRMLVSRPGSEPNQSLKATIAEFVLPRENLVVGRLLGKGHFGRVYAAMLREPGEHGQLLDVAVKTLKYKPEETEMVELFLREAVMMKDFQHPHVLSLIGVCFTQDESPMVVLPFMANGDLRRYIRDPTKEITVLELLRLGYQVCEGMRYLCSMRFVHRDLAARNCMVDEHLDVKVADFGLSRDLYSRDYYRVGAGTALLPVRWMSVESLQDNIFTTLSDVWSFGVLLWELMTRGAVPYSDIDNWDIRHYLLNGRRLAQPPYCPENVYAIQEKCWARKPADRPTFDELCYLLRQVINGQDPIPIEDKRGLFTNVERPVTEDMDQMTPPSI